VGRVPGIREFFLRTPLVDQSGNDPEPGHTARRQVGRDPTTGPLLTVSARDRSEHPAGAGFTLLEMLIVLVISSIVMATLIPNFAPAIARAQLYSATRDVASALRHTRGQAMLKGQDALFELNTLQHTYRITGRPKVYKLPAEIELGLFTTTTETLDEGTGRIRFFPDGSATGGRVTLIASKQTRVVDVNWLTGEVRMGDDDSEQ
jgi:general secretion pathway protein H